jgi:hypothetical protein
MDFDILATNEVNGSDERVVCRQEVSDKRESKQSIARAEAIERERADPLL